MSLDDFFPVDLLHQTDPFFLDSSKLSSCLLACWSFFDVLNVEDVLQVQPIALELFPLLDRVRN